MVDRPDLVAAAPVEEDDVAGLGLRDVLARPRELRRTRDLLSERDAEVARLRYMLRTLTGQDITHIPPGVMVHALRNAGPTPHQGIWVTVTGRQVLCMVSGAGHEPDPVAESQVWQWLTSQVTDSQVTDTARGRPGQARIRFERSELPPRLLAAVLPRGTGYVALVSTGLPGSQERQVRRGIWRSWLARNPNIRPWVTIAIPAIVMLKEAYDGARRSISMSPAAVLGAPLVAAMVLLPATDTPQRQRPGVEEPRAVAPVERPTHPPSPAQGRMQGTSGSASTGEPTTPRPAVTTPGPAAPQPSFTTTPEPVPDEQQPPEQEEEKKPPEPEKSVERPEPDAPENDTGRPKCPKRPEASILRTVGGIVTCIGDAGDRLLAGP